MKYRAWLLLGPTGSGKSPLGKLLETKNLSGLSFCHFDFGQELRNIAAAALPTADFTNEEVVFIRRVLQQGALLENETFYLAKKIFLAFVRRQSAKKNGIVVLNGLPRHHGQAKDMRGLVNIQKLIVLQATPEDLALRIQANVGGDRAKRTDDGLTAIQKKLATYYARTAPLVDHYREQGSQIITLKSSAATTANDLFDALVAHLNTG